MFDIFCCKYSEEDCSSRGELTDIKLLFHLQNYRTCVVPSAGVHTPESREVRTTEDASPKFAYLILRNVQT